MQLFTSLYIYLVQPKSIHLENESESLKPPSHHDEFVDTVWLPIFIWESLHSALTKVFGIYILNGFDKKLDDRFNNKHIELWSVMKALLPENDDFCISEPCQETVRQ